MAESIHLFAAGSLRAALTDVAKAFEKDAGTAVQTRFGASGLLKDEIVGGAKADVFASANMEHPQALSAAGKAGPTVRFARNRLCALVKPGWAVESGTLLARMLDASVKVGTSTPRADPSGDYAQEVFRKAEALQAGAQRALQEKSLQLTGSATSAAPPAGRNVYGWHIAEGRADIFLCYCTAAREAKAQNPDQQIVPLPEPLAVGADYGIATIAGAPADAQRFVAFTLSPVGQQILAGYGFAPARD